MMPLIWIVCLFGGVLSEGRRNRVIFAALLVVAMASSLIVEYGTDTRSMQPFFWMITSGAALCLIAVMVSRWHWLRAAFGSPLLLYLTVVAEMCDGRV